MGSGTEMMEATKIAIFTSEYVNPRNDCDWFWKVFQEFEYFEEFIEDDSGIMDWYRERDCPDCSNYFIEIAEFYSVVDALNRVKINHPELPVAVYVTSQLLSLLETEPELFMPAVEKTKSCQLIAFAKKIRSQIDIMDVEFVEDCYSNKDILPNYQYGYI